MNTLTMALQRASSSARERADTLREVFNHNGDALFLTRALPSAIFLLVAIGVLVATRMHSIVSARELEQARARLDEVRATTRHLEVERALLRNPARLREVAAGMGLTAPVAVVHLGPTARDRIVDAVEGPTP